jgi:hypothetical protein
MNIRATGAGQSHNLIRMLEETITNIRDLPAGDPWSDTRNENNWWLLWGTLFPGIALIAAIAIRRPPVAVYIMKEP